MNRRTFLKLTGGVAVSVPFARLVPVDEWEQMPTHFAYRNTRTGEVRSAQSFHP